MKKGTRDKKARQALRHLARIRELMAKRPSPYEGMTKDEAIEEMRKIREQLWEEKFATRP